MYMAFRKNIILFLPLFLIACAQVGVLSGGDKDETAPQLIVEKTVPANEIINFSGNKIEMTFDEFIQLNNPGQTIVMLPGNIKTKTSVHKKTLNIEWDDKLEENTTYVIYLNGTVKDVTENNDSLMTFAFSTGETLDSLKYSVTVTDAFTGQFVKDALVGLFNDSIAVKPYYFARTNKFGKASFFYLKKGKYYVRAFTDENKDLQIQASESIAFQANSLHLDSSMVDTIPLRMSKPKERNKIRTFKYLAPGSFIVGANYQIDEARFFINTQEIKPSSIWMHSKDSVQLFMDVKNLSDIQLVVKSPIQSDTSSLRIIEKEKKVKISIQSLIKDKQVGPHQEISFSVNDLITNIDSSKIIIVNPSDSTTIKNFKVQINQNRLVLDFKRNGYEELNILFKQEAIRTLNEMVHDSTGFTFFFKKEKDYGIINLKLSGFEEPVIVELLQNNKVVSGRSFDGSNIFRFENLLPGEYHFRIIEDSNSNGLWDSGDLEKNQQAEMVYLFPEPVKVRANWEIDLHYSPKK